MKVKMKIRFLQLRAGKPARKAVSVGVGRRKKPLPHGFSCQIMCIHRGFSIFTQMIDAYVNKHMYIHVQYMWTH